jgi:3-isopropylmalate/(R)-2-methylmalate dehydratase small subunit
MGAIIAESYSRIYFRNCINAGLPALEIKNLLGKVKRGDTVEINTETGTVTLPDGSKVTFPSLPPEVDEIMQCGGLDEYIKAKLAGK